jgi:hypothetical protein
MFHTILALLFQRGKKMLDPVCAPKNKTKTATHVVSAIARRITMTLGPRIAND